MWTPKKWKTSRCFYSLEKLSARCRDDSRGYFASSFWHLWHRVIFRKCSLAYSWGSCFFSKNLKMPYLKSGGPYESLNNSLCSTQKYYQTQDREAIESFLSTWNFIFSTKKLWKFWLSKIRTSLFFFINKLVVRSKYFGKARLKWGSYGSKMMIKAF